MLMQTFGVSNEEYYDMLWYFLEWSSVIAINFVICLPTKHLGILKNSLKRVRAIQIESEFGSVGF